jgi:hypothetical protein
VVRRKMGLVMASNSAGLNFSAGFMVGFIVGVLLVLWLFAVDTDVKREAKLPDWCRPGERVLMTTAPKAEYYECEAHWVRK